MPRKPVHCSVCDKPRPWTPTIRTDGTMICRKCRSDGHGRLRDCARCGKRYVRPLTVGRTCCFECVPERTFDAFRVRQCAHCSRDFQAVRHTPRGPRHDAERKHCDACKELGVWRSTPSQLRVDAARENLRTARETIRGRCPSTLKPRTCAGCAELFVRARGSRRKYCLACADAQAWATPRIRTEEGGWRTCARCQGEFHRPSSRQGQYTCNPCRRNDPTHLRLLETNRRAGRAKRGYGDARKRARHFGVEYEPVDRRKVFARDKWQCGLCPEKVDKRLQYPHPRSASLDHVIPISRGGGHTYANTQCSHLDCNVKKGARSGGEQLALIG